MKIVFMGTPAFAVPSLQALHDAGHEIGYVITQPDRAKGRGKKIEFMPVKALALDLGIPVLQPEKVKGCDALLEKLRAYAPDVIVVVAYGMILPAELISIPRLGCINVHASLLPRHRGAAPIQRAILAGDRVSGVTIMYIEEALDAGDMLAKEEVEIGERNAAQLSEVLSQRGAALLLKTLPHLADGTIHPEKQNEEEATYAPMLSKRDGLMDFSKMPEELVHMVRGLNPWPGAYTYFEGGIFKIWEAKACDTPCKQPPGTVVRADEEGIFIAAGGRLLCASVVQAPGKKRISAKAFLLGHRIADGTVLG